MNELSTSSTRSTWSGVFRIGGVAVLIAIPIYLLDIGISMAIEGADIRPDALNAINLFALYQENWLLGFRALGLINVATLAVSVPLFVALYGAHQQECRAYAALALIVWLVGATVYISNNAAIPMSVLSSKYASATTDSQRTLLAAAGEAMIARGADFTPGSFVGFILTDIAALGFSLILLRSRVFVCCWRRLYPAGRSRPARRCRRSFPPASPLAPTTWRSARTARRRPCPRR